MIADVGLISRDFKKGQTMSDSLPFVLPSAFHRPEQSILGMGYALLIDGKQTGGAFEVMQFVVPPEAGPPPHIHRREDECFYIVNGEFELTLGERTLRARAGDCVHLPREQPHSFRNVCGEQATFLCWVMPANLAGFFEAFARPWPADQAMPAPVEPADVERLMAAAAKYQIDILTGSPD